MTPFAHSFSMAWALASSIAILCWGGLPADKLRELSVTRRTGGSSKHNSEPNQGLQVRLPLTAFQTEDPSGRP